MAALQGQLDIWRYMLGFVDTMALTTAVELGIADIIHSHGGPITLRQIASSIKGSTSSSSSSDDNIPSLGRIMRLLVRHRIFSARHPSDGGETLYGLTDSSMWLVTESELNLAPFVTMEYQPALLAPWHYIGQCIKEGGVPFKRAHGVEMWEMTSKNPHLNKVFNDAMACSSKITIEAVLTAYKDVFGSIGTLVDVGGGTGSSIDQIVKANPNIRGINLDLPHVVASAPPFPGVDHVGGSMFESVPAADAIFMKVLGVAYLGDDECAKILKNCKKALPEKGGRLIIVEAVLRPESDEAADDIAISLDVLMFTYMSGGKERTELEWKNLLAEGGFPRYNIIKILDPRNVIIEAFPN